jgi:hypothetical protein
VSFEDLVIVTFTGAIAGEQTQTWSFRGSKSRNKVSVGEPAEGSLTLIQNLQTLRELFLKKKTQLFKTSVLTKFVFFWVFHPTNLFINPIELFS